MFYNNTHLPTILAQDSSSSCAHVKTGTNIKWRYLKYCCHLKRKLVQLDLTVCHHRGLASRPVHLHFHSTHSEAQCPEHWCMITGMTSTYPAEANSLYESRNTLTKTEVSALPPKKFRWLMITLASSCLNTSFSFTSSFISCPPQVDSTNKFSEDLPSKHEHSPGCQVDPKNNAHSAGTHHVLGDWYIRKE